jgi:hypothetical protein
MAFAGFSYMILVMLFVGLFDMSLRVVVDIFCTSKAHILWMGLFLAPVGVDVPRVVSFLAVPLC